MDIFDNYAEVINRYAEYVQSFLSITDGLILDFISRGIFDGPPQQANDEAIRRELEAQGVAGYRDPVRSRQRGATARTNQYLRRRICLMAG